jgi:hypothetical protein
MPKDKKTENKDAGGKGLSRRDFLVTGGADAANALIAASPDSIKTTADTLMTESFV